MRHGNANDASIICLVSADKDVGRLAGKNGAHLKRTMDRVGRRVTTSSKTGVSVIAYSNAKAGLLTIRASRGGTLCQALTSVGNASATKSLSSTLTAMRAIRGGSGGGSLTSIVICASNVKTGRAGGLGDRLRTAVHIIKDPISGITGAFLSYAGSDDKSACAITSNIAGCDSRTTGVRVALCRKGGVLRIHALSLTTSRACAYLFGRIG